MRLAPFYAGTVLLTSLAEAHGGIPGMPKIFGRSPFGEPSKRMIGPVNAPRPDRSRIMGKKKLAIRQNLNGPCGPGKGACAAGRCCSVEGYCGVGIDYCSAPDCQINYGPACDANKTPPGASTSGIARPKVGSIPYGGAGIYDCIKNGVIALTFDDGPYLYTKDILDVLKAANAKATFFITGNNLGKGEIDDESTIYPALIRRMIADGHQIASHTWSHQDLSTITAAQRNDQMVGKPQIEIAAMAIYGDVLADISRDQQIKNEMAIRNILGYFPTYMRPPYSSCNGACQTTLNTLGYHITYFDVDTDDYNQDSPTLIQNAKNNFNNAIKNKPPASNDFLVIGHDIHTQTVYNLTQYMLTTLTSYGFRTATVGECLNDPPANWYRSASGGGSVSSTSTVVPPSSTTQPPASSSSTRPPSSSSGVSSSAQPSSSPRPVSQDATCGKQSTNKATCQGSTFGNCCSQYGWCGSTAAYCSSANSCQVGFGTCN